MSLRIIPMDQRQLEKERIRLTREIAMLENQLESAIRGKEEKLTENKQIKDEIVSLEEENKTLEEKSPNSTKSSSRPRSTPDVFDARSRSTAKEPMAREGARSSFRPLSRVTRKPSKPCVARSSRRLRIVVLSNRS
jgi:hypothetical protein